MKKLFFIFAFLSLLVPIMTEAQTQTTVHVYGSDAYITGNGTHGGPYSNAVHAGYNNSDSNRSFITWTGIRNKVPLNAAVTSVQFYIPFQTNTTDFNLIFTRFTDDGNVNDEWSAIYNGDGSALGNGNATSSTHLYSFSALTQRVQDIVNGTGNDVVSVGIRSQVENNSYFYAWYDGGSIDLQITYTYNVAIDQKDVNGNSFGQVEIWNPNPSTQNVPYYFNMAPGTNNLTLGSQQIVYNGNQKYYQWENQASVVNPHTLSVVSGSNQFTAQFGNVDATATINLTCDGYTTSSGNVEFMDPWRIDGSGSFGAQNQGMSAPFEAWTAPIYLDMSHLYNNIPYNGVFLNQTTNLTAYYSARALLSQSVTINGKSAPATFLYWTNSNATLSQQGTSSGYDQKAVVFTGSNATVTANYKGIHISNDASAFSNNSQRKFIRIPDAQGDLLQVYTSMGHVWLESSTDGGSTWKLEHGGAPLDYDFFSGYIAPGGKCPSIDYYYNSTTGVTFVGVLFEKKNGNNYTINYENFWPEPSFGYDYPLVSQAIYSETSDLYSTNANPNISYGPPGVIFTYERKSSSGGTPGINYMAVNDLDIHGYITEGAYHVSGTIAGTNANSINATINCNHSESDTFTPTALAWQQQNAGNIEFAYLGVSSYSGNYFTMYQSTDQNISGSGDGPLNYQPSIVEMPDNSARVCWIEDETGSGVPAFIKAVYWDNNTPSQYKMYDANVQSVSLNLTDDGNSCFAWSTQTTSGAWYNRASTGASSSMTTLNTSGQNLQLCNADTKADMHVSSFYSSAAPYYFATSGNLGSVQKSSPVQILYGRGLTLVKGDLKFHYSLNNLTVNGNSINFVSAPDSVKRWSLDTLNTILETEPFSITSSSKFLFNEDCGFLDSTAVASVLGDSGYVRYSAVLIDNSTGKSIGTIRDVTLNSGNTHGYALVPYLLNTDGIGTKTVRIKFTVTTNIDSPQVALINSYQLEGVGDSSSVQSLSLQQVNIIKDYELSQNYPNPFNPTTIISYQLPKDGHVSLKVYDVLGREVATLVDANQTVGRYNVNFDGSRLASGVYFYRLTSGSYVSTKKM